MPPVITRCRAVLERFESSVATPGEVRFRQVVDDGEAPHVLPFSLPLSAWEDLGNPETITISIEAGDLLNEPIQHGCD